MKAAELNFIDCLIRNGFTNDTICIVKKKTFMSNVFTIFSQNFEIADVGYYIWNERVYDYDKGVYFQENAVYEDFLKNKIFYYKVDI